jgi:hypothetical protein
MKFTNKDEYLRWRSEWKANYKTLIQQIRDVKFARWFEDSRRGGVKMNAAQTQRYEAIAKAHKTQWGFFPNHVLKQLRDKATTMLAERATSKIAAQECYQARQLHPA